MEERKLMVFPWFSKQEWIEVYRQAYDGGISGCREAYSQMNVWKARAYKLPVGVEITMPLLHAKLVECNSKVEPKVKSLVIGNAIQSFVTTVVKMGQSGYVHTLPMNILAEEIGLPKTLLDLRNDIVHSNNSLAGIHTLKSGLDQAWKWVENFYWKIEVIKMEDKMEDLNNVDIHPVDEGNSSQKAILLEKKSRLCANFIYSTKATNKLLLNAAFRKLLSKAEDMFLEDPLRCLDIIVTNLLLPEKFKVINSSYTKSCNCGCTLAASVIVMISKIITKIMEMGGTTKLIIFLINKPKDNDNFELGQQWIRLVAAIFLKPCSATFKTRCKYHSINITNLSELNLVVRWKEVIEALLITEQDWANQYAFSLMGIPEMQLTQLQQSKIKELFNIYKSSVGVKKDTKDENCNNELSTDIYDLDSLVETVQKIQGTSFDKIKIRKLCYDGYDSGATDCQFNGTAIGFLPYQSQNPYFYKELLLNYPIEEEYQQQKKIKTV